MNVGHFQQISFAHCTFTCSGARLYVRVHEYVYTYVLSRNPINLYSASLHIPKLTSKLQQQERLHNIMKFVKRVCMEKAHQITMLCRSRFKCASLRFAWLNIDDIEIAKCFFFLSSLFKQKNEMPKDENDNSTQYILVGVNLFANLGVVCRLGS